MTRPIESVLAEALQRLEASGRLEVSAYVSAYPEHAEELRSLLPVLMTLHAERRWQRAEADSRAFALNLIAELAPQPETVSTLFTRERDAAGLSLEQQSIRSGLPVRALEELAHDTTPVQNLDNAVIKQLAAQVSAPFAALAKEVRRLLSLESLSGAGPQAVFTRNQATSTEEEQKALLDQVREASRKRPEQEKK